MIAYPPGTVIKGYDRKYVVDQHGSWRVLEYNGEERRWKKLLDMILGLNVSNEPSIQLN